jgi:phosphopantothenoylcysteine decarboxylase/phosphopantothenate--cysteine ligase
MRVVLGISGGIAAYKTPDLVRRLREAGHEVRCVLTASGAQLVSHHALTTVSEYPCALPEAMWPDDGTMAHIGLPRWAEALLIAPLTAHTLARLSLGLADDLLTTLVLALEPEKPVVVAPAMNSVMWAKPVVQQHVGCLRERGVQFVEPEVGELACGEVGPGKMADAAAIVAKLGQLG